jgi:hypothetical protein
MEEYAQFVICCVAAIVGEKNMQIFGGWDIPSKTYNRPTSWYVVFFSLP